jgi:hypothetical protein
VSELRRRSIAAFTPILLIQVLKVVVSSRKRRANHRFDLTQTSSPADGTQSLFPSAAEEATSRASRTWSVCKTQLLLPRSVLPVICCSINSDLLLMAKPFPPALAADGIAQPEFLQKRLTESARPHPHVIAPSNLSYKPWTR